MVVGGFTPLCAKKIHSFIGPSAYLLLQGRKTVTNQCICLLILTYSSIATKMLNVKPTRLFNTEAKCYLGSG